MIVAFVVKPIKIVSLQRNTACQWTDRRCRRRRHIHDKYNNNECEWRNEIVFIAIIHLIKIFQMITRWSSIDHHNCVHSFHTFTLIATAVTKATHYIVYAFLIWIWSKCVDKRLNNDAKQWDDMNIFFEKVKCFK